MGKPIGPAKIVFGFVGGLVCLWLILAGMENLGYLGYLPPEKKVEAKLWVETGGLFSEAKLGITNKNKFLWRRAKIKLNPNGGEHYAAFLVGFKPSETIKIPLSEFLNKRGEEFDKDVRGIQIKVFEKDGSLLAAGHYRIVKEAVGQ